MHVLRMVRLEHLWRSIPAEERTGEFSTNMLPPADVATSESLTYKFRASRPAPHAGAARRVPPPGPPLVNSQDSPAAPHAVVPSDSALEGLHACGLLNQRWSCAHAYESSSGSKGPRARTPHPRAAAIQ